MPSKAEAEEQKEMMTLLRLIDSLCGIISVGVEIEVLRVEKARIAETGRMMYSSGMQNERTHGDRDGLEGPNTIDEPRASACRMYYIDIFWPLLDKLLCNYAIQVREEALQSLSTIPEERGVHLKMCSSQLGYRPRRRRWRQRNEKQRWGF